ncbi:peptidase S24 [Comamonas thiooxydans]|uniref:Peptidase S24 n=1 Tax=Comamonas thiooxydans TaxID=363952 RepID=A0A0E3BDC2_9BURK|nr:helix-turn-helix transcriptional regulator [Comamonas thiooxydans]KGG90979.1 peptidase S24 [Comamonas thiooxydans]
MPALPLTPEQKADAARLKQLFQRWKADRRAQGLQSSQDTFSDQVGFGQSAVSQYLNGKIPLNPAAAAKFSKALGCQISDFSATIAAAASEIGEAVQLPGQEAGRAGGMDITELSKLEMQLVLMFRELHDQAKDEVISLTNQLHNSVMPARSAANPYPGVPAPKQKPAPAPKANRKKTESAEH